jgi:hypothetical protein
VRRLIPASLSHVSLARYQVLLGPGSATAFLAFDASSNTIVQLMDLAVLGLILT